MFISAELRETCTSCHSVATDICGVSYALYFSVLWFDTGRLGSNSWYNPSIFQMLIWENMDSIPGRRWHKARMYPGWDARTSQGIYTHTLGNSEMPHSSLDFQRRPIWDPPSGRTWEIHTHTQCGSLIQTPTNLGVVSVSQRDISPKSKMKVEHFNSFHIQSGHIPYKIDKSFHPPHSYSSTV